MSKQKNWKERNGKYYTRVTYRDSTGRRREIWRPAENRSRAKEEADTIKQQLKQGTEPFEHTGTLDDYLDSWLRTINQKVSQSTHEDYVFLLRLYIRPLLGRKKVSAIKPLDVQEAIIKMQDKHLSPRTVRYAYTVLHSALKQAVRWRILLHNPAEGIELPKQIRKEMKCLTPEEARTFLEFASKDKHGLLFELAIITGMRPEEYLGLLWSDINFENHTVTIQRTLIWKHKSMGWYFGEPKTEKSRRTIHLPVSLCAELIQHRKRQLERRIRLGEKWTHYNLVFPSDLGTPFYVRNLDKRHFKVILTNAQLPNIRLYDLRHTCATLLLLAGENPKVVAERLGHSSIVQTLNTYSHVLPTMQKSATERLEGILKRS